MSHVEKPQVLSDYFVYICSTLYQLTTNVFLETIPRRQSFKMLKKTSENAASVGDMNTAFIDIIKNILTTGINIMPQ